MIQCIAIDDESWALELIKSYCDRTEDLELVKTFTNPLEGAEYLRDNSVDLLLIDIQMPRMTGMEVLHHLINPPAFIFTTAFNEYAAKSYEMQAVDFLVKPISFKRFTQGITKVRALKAQELAELSSDSEQPHSTNQRGFLFIKENNKKIKIFYDEILYIEAQRDYVLLQLEGSKKLSLMTLKYVEELLPKDQFIRIHRSYIVGINKIDTVHSKELTVGSKILPVSNTYSKIVKQTIDALR